MNEQKFWDLIQKSQTEENPILWITEMLEQKRVKEVVAFDEWSGHFCRNLNTPKVLKSLEENGMFVSTDGFEYFQAWVISQGQVAYDLVLTGDFEKYRYLLPNNGDNIEFPPSNEAFLYIAMDAYKLKHEKLQHHSNEDEDRLLILMHEDFYEAATIIRTQLKIN